MSDAPRFFDRMLGADLVAALVGVPVVTIVADTDDGLGRRHLLQRIVQAVVEPGLAGDRPSRITYRMFVVDHQEQTIGSSGKGLQVPGVGVDRYRQVDHEAFLRQDGVRLLHKGQIVLQRTGRHQVEGFEIEGDAVEMAGMQRRVDLADQLLALDRAGQQLRRPLRIPAFVGDVLHHQEIGRLVLGVQHQLVELVIRTIDVGVSRPRDRSQHRQHHVDIVDVFFQRGARRVVPRRIEAGDRLVDVVVATAHRQRHVPRRGAVILDLPRLVARIFHMQVQAFGHRHDQDRDEQADGQQHGHPDQGQHADERRLFALTRRIVENRILHERRARNRCADSVERNGDKGNRHFTLFSTHQAYAGTERPGVATRFRNRRFRRTLWRIPDRFLPKRALFNWPGVRRLPAKSLSDRSGPADSGCRRCANRPMCAQRHR